MLQANKLPFIKYRLTVVVHLLFFLASLLCCQSMHAGLLCCQSMHAGLVIFEYMIKLEEYCIISVHNVVLPFLFLDLVVVDVYS
jgi:hypothetical protein